MWDKYFVVYYFIPDLYCCCLRLSRTRLDKINLTLVWPERLILLWPFQIYYDSFCSRRCFLTFLSLTIFEAISSKVFWAQYWKPFSCQAMTVTWTGVLSLPRQNLQIAFSTRPMLYISLFSLQWLVTGPIVILIIITQQAFWPIFF